MKKKSAPTPLPPETANTSPAPIGATAGIRVENCYVFKSRLQEYAQKAGLQTPEYHTSKEGPSHEPVFKSTVVINNTSYGSLPGFSNRKAAEQSAAEVALMEIVKSIPANANIPAVQETGLCNIGSQQLNQREMHREADHHHCLLATLARHRRLAAAATLFSSTLRTARALNSLLAAICSSPAFLRFAPKVLLLAAPSVSPNATSFHILTSTLCQAHRPTAAADLLCCMPSLLLDPDPASCRAVLSSLCQYASAQDAVAFLDKMCHWGISPSRSDYHAVFDALLQEGKVAEAYEVMKNKMGSNGVAPALAYFKLIMQAFSETAEFDSVEEGFDEMLLRGLVPDVDVYNVYISALCRKGDLAGARRMMTCMEHAGCPPDIRTFGVVVSGCMSAGDMGTVRELVQEAIRRGLRWDPTALSELIGLRQAGGGATQAHELLLEPLFVHDALVLGQLIGALCKQGLLGPAAQETGLCKNLLQEYAQKMNYAIPSYICTKPASGLAPFICTVEIGGIQYIGAAARTKKDAEIKAARTALLAIQGQSEGSANGATKYIVVPGKRVGKEVEKRPIETPKPLKAKKGGFKKKWNKRKFMKKDGQAVDVEKDEARVAGDAHDSDVLMQPTVITQEASCGTLFLQPCEEAKRVEDEPPRDIEMVQPDKENQHSDAALVQPDDEARVEQEPSRDISVVQPNEEAISAKQEPSIDAATLQPKEEAVSVKPEGFSLSTPEMKTGCVALVLCLNISVDPPDVIKISPCVRKECWIDPFSMAPPKALETIGKTLHSQYERWQPKARYKLQLDPTLEEV
uniref:DRBM domain-containing protein n=1 Tax=Oryza rufipogon TaxID=4529 RepID=A0A0E0PKG6_ORYRU